MKKLSGQGSMPDLINDSKYNINTQLDNLPSSNDLNDEIMEHPIDTPINY